MAGVLFVPTHIAPIRPCAYYFTCVSHLDGEVRIWKLKVESRRLEVDILNLCRIAHTFGGDGGGGEARQSWLARITARMRRSPPVFFPGY